MRRLLLLCFAVVLSGAIGMTPAAAQETDENTLLDIIQAEPELSIFADLIATAGLDDLFTQTDRSYTVFAPSNAAFDDMPAPVMAYLSAQPQLVERLLGYHLLDDARMSDALESSRLATVEGSELTVFVDDSGVSLDGVPLIMTNNTATNGVLHTLDSLLVPPLTLPAVDPLEITGDIRIAGSSTVFPLTERIREDFYAGGYTDEITIQSIGTGGGFEAFCVSGETDISNASRAIRPEERDLCQARGRVPLRFTVGMDAMAVAVSTDNTFVENLSLSQLADVFSTATTWADVNPDWPDEPIARYIPGTDSGTFDYFVSTVFDGEADRLLDAGNKHLSEDDTVLVEGIEDNPYAIGFFGYAYYSENRDILDSISVNGVAPTEDSAESGTYRLARPLYIYSAPSVMQQKPRVAAFINYYLTNVNEEVQDVGYFPASRRMLNLSRLFWLAATETAPQ
jgi:phosphate transport system substrate-binding protein